MYGLDMYRLGLIAEILNNSRKYRKWRYWTPDALKMLFDSHGIIDKMLLAFSQLSTETIESLRDACADRGYIPNYVFGAMLGVCENTRRTWDSIEVLLRNLS